MPKTTKSRKFTGALKQPIVSNPWVVALLTHGEPEQKQKQIKTEETMRVCRLIMKKLDLLLAHYGIDENSEQKWMMLSLALGMDCVPGMKVVDHRGSKGRPAKWLGLNVILVLSVDKIANERGKGIADAVQILVKREHQWGSYKGKESSLETRYYEAKKQSAVLLRSG